MESGAAWMSHHQRLGQCRWQNDCGGPSGVVQLRGLAAAAAVLSTAAGRYDWQPASVGNWWLHADDVSRDCSMHRPVLSPQPYTVWWKGVDKPWLTRHCTLINNKTTKEALGCHPMLCVIHGVYLTCSNKLTNSQLSLPDGCRSVVSFSSTIHRARSVFMDARSA